MAVYIGRYIEREVERSIQTYMHRSTVRRIHIYIYKATYIAVHIHCFNHLPLYLLGQGYLNSRGNQCYDNFIIPRTFDCRVRILEPPPNFAEMMHDALAKYKADSQDQYDTRSRKTKIFYHACMNFSDHKPIALKFNRAELL